jgi:hypothetical protein
MSQPRIIVISDASAQSFAIEIQTILQRDNRYHAELATPSSPDWTRRDRRPDLIIALPSPSPDKTIRFLSTLRLRNPHTPILPVVRSEHLNEMPGEVSQWSEDFVVTPLRLQYNGIEDITIERP